MVIPDDEQREHLVREGEQTSRSGKALLQSHRATCGDVPHSLRDLGITAKHRTSLDMRSQLNWCAKPYRTPNQALRLPT